MEGASREPLPAFRNSKAIQLPYLPPSLNMYIAQSYIQPHLFTYSNSNTTRTHLYSNLGSILRCWHSCARTLLLHALNVYMTRCQQVRSSRSNSVFNQTRQSSHLGEYTLAFCSNPLQCCSTAIETGGHLEHCSQIHVAFKYIYKYI